MDRIRRSQPGGVDEQFHGSAAHLARSGTDERRLRWPRAALTCSAGLFRRRPRRFETGIYMGTIQRRRQIYPHSSQPPLIVAARAARRLNIGDRLEYEVSPRTGLVENVRVYRPAALR